MIAYCLPMPYKKLPIDYLLKTPLCVGPPLGPDRGGRGAAVRAGGPQKAQHMGGNVNIYIYTYI